MERHPVLEGAAGKSWVQVRRSGIELGQLGVLPPQPAKEGQHGQQGRTPEEKGRAEWIHLRINVTSPACSTDDPSRNTAATRHT